MNRFKSNPKLLFRVETVFNLRPLEKYEILFSFLDTPLLEILYPSTGRPPIPYEALLKALVYKNIKNVSWSEPLRLDTLNLKTPCIPESLSLPITSHIPPEADNPKRNATSFYYTHLL